MKFELCKESELERTKLFNLSTDIEQFDKILPKYFKSLLVTDIQENTKFVDEKVIFFGKSILVKTKHVIMPPKIHEVYILSGPFTGTSFIERYDKTSRGTKLTITVSLKLNGFAKILFPFSNPIKNKMDRVLDEFLISCQEIVLKN